MSTQHLTISARPSRVASLFFTLTLLVSFVSTATATPHTLHENSVQEQQQSQTPATTDRERAEALLKQGKNTEALPFLERAAADAPTDARLMYQLGYTRAVASMNVSDAAAQRRARVKARIELTRAKELGYESALLEATLRGLPPDGANPPRFSENPVVEEAMNAGEAAFARGEFAKAREGYQRALELDPAQYFAALFVGDMFFKEGYAKPKGGEQSALFDQSGEWFARAIKINPNIETAYRYWGSALMDGGKMDEALEKVVEAYIRMPYQKLSPQGLLRWASMNKMEQPKHPLINIPTGVERKSNGDMNINLDMSMMDDKKKDGTNHWFFYGLSRAAYQSASFAKDHPTEKTYRHTLSEEVNALRMVADAVNEDVKKKKIKKLDPSLANLVKLHNDGLLEAYILLARPDEGIAQDYAAYLEANPDKLRRYVRQYVMGRSN